MTNVGKICINIPPIIFDIFELFQKKKSRGVKSKFTQFTNKAWTFDPVQCLLHFLHMLYGFLLGDNMPVICMFPPEASQRHTEEILDNTF